jgi:DNA-binding transcriptional LysR family regulator
MLMNEGGRTMNINLELYKVFYFVAKNESISRAANELSISQPAISKSIKSLEEQANANLFIRKRDGVELTEAGKTFYKKIKDAMDLIYSAENDLKVLTNMESGIINIGASKTILHEFLMPYIKEFHKKYPKITIRIFTDKPTELIRKAKIGLIDVIFTNLPFSLPVEFEQFKLMDLHDCFAVNSNFDYLLDKKFTKNDLENLPLLVLTKGATTRIRLDDYCTENNITINPEMEFGSNTLIKEFTEAGFGVGMLTEEHIKKELANGELFKLNIELPLKEKYLGMVWNNENKSLVSRNFIKYMENNISKN